jgi:Ca-activated chloride channel homolog
MRGVLLFFLCSAAIAQNAAIQREVRFTAIDRKGQILQIPPHGEVFALVNDKYQSTPFEVTSTNELPLRIGVVVDASNSVQQQRTVNAIVGGSLRFVGSRLKSGDKAFVASVQSQVALLQDWTDDGKLLIQSVQSLRASGGTALFDGIYFACKKMADEPSLTRKILIVASDGDDNQSHATMNEAERKCAASGVAINSLDYDPGNTAFGRGAKLLRHLASSSSGVFYAPTSEKEIGQALEQLNFYWEAEYRGTATFLSFPGDKKFKNVFVIPLIPPDGEKFPASFLGLPPK